MGKGFIWFVLNSLTPCLSLKIKWSSHIKKSLYLNHRIKMHHMVSEISPDSFELNVLAIITWVFWNQTWCGNPRDFQMVNFFFFQWGLLLTKLNVWNRLSPHKESIYLGSNKEKTRFAIHLSTLTFHFIRYTCYCYCQLLVNINI